MSKRMKEFLAMASMTMALASVGESPAKMPRKPKREFGVYYPNRRTKAGKALDEFLRYKKETFRYDEVLDILGCETLYGNFIIPFMGVVNDTVLIYLDNRNIPKSDDVIEITSKEFKSLLKGDSKQ